MFQKLFSFSKLFWIKAHLLELVLGFVVAHIIFSGQSGLEVFSPSGQILMYVWAFVLFDAIAVTYFPTALAWISPFRELFKNAPEYASSIVMIVLFVVYYALWIVPDKKWSERSLRWVRPVRITWFLISSICAWIVLYQQS